MDSDELATITAAVLYELGVPYRFVIQGDGVNWVSIRVVRDDEPALGG